MGTEERVRIMELAWEWVRDRTITVTGDDMEAVIEEYAKRFDKAYKEIFKTVNGSLQR